MDNPQEQVQSNLGLKLLLLGGLFVVLVLGMRMLSNQPPQPIQKSDNLPPQPISEPEVISQSFAEDSYEQILWQCIYLGQKELEQFQGVTVKQFQRDIQDAENSEGVSPRITLLRKLNYVRGNLDQSLSEQTHFGGAAQSRGIVRPAILDSLAVLYAMKAETDGVTIQNVELSPAEYLDCLDQLNHWGKKAEMIQPEFQRLKRQPHQLPREKTAQATEDEADEWQPY